MQQVITSEKDAFQFCEETKILKQRIEKGGLELAKRLCFIKQNNLAEGQYGGFDLYLDEIKLKKATADHMMRVYQRFCMDFGIDEATVVEAGGYTRLYELLPLAKTKETALEALQIASQLESRESIKAMVKKQMAGGEEIPDCAHEESECFYLRVCKACGLKEKVDPAVISEQHQQHERDTQ